MKCFENQCISCVCLYLYLGNILWAFHHQFRILEITNRTSCEPLFKSSDIEKSEREKVLWLAYQTVIKSWSAKVPYRCDGENGLILTMDLLFDVNNRINIRNEFRYPFFCSLSIDFCRFVPCKCMTVSCRVTPTILIRNMQRCYRW